MATIGLSALIARAELDLRPHLFFGPNHRQPSIPLEVTIYSADFAAEYAVYRNP